MEKYKVDFYPDNKSAEVEKGSTVLKAAHLAGAHINASCGGIGTCGQCKIFIEKGEYQTKRSEKLTEEEWEKGYRLACQTTVEGDLVIKIPPESKLDRTVLKRKEKDKEATQFGLTAKKLTIEEVFDSTPYVVKKYLELTRPNIENNMSDLQRIIQALKKEYSYESLEVDFKSIKYIPDTLRRSDWKVTVLIQEKEGYVPKIIGIEEGDSRAKHYAIAVDIGTTTLYVQLLDLNKREVLAEASDYNPQISYGEDVITRILYAIKGDGLKQLQEVLIKNLNKLIDEVVSEANVEKKIYLINSNCW